MIFPKKLDELKFLERTVRFYAEFHGLEFQPYIQERLRTFLSPWAYTFVGYYNSSLHQGVHAKSPHYLDFPHNGLVPLSFKGFSEKCLQSNAYRAALLSLQLSDCRSGPCITPSLCDKFETSDSVSGFEVSFLSFRLFFSNIPRIFKTPLGRVLARVLLSDHSYTLSRESFNPVQRSALLKCSSRDEISTHTDAYGFIISRTIPVELLEEGLFTLSEGGAETICGASSAHWWNSKVRAQMALGRSFIFQHGGAYGLTSRPSISEIVERRYFDRFISWGWEGTRVFPFVAPLFFLRAVGSYDPTGPIVIVLTRVRRFSRGNYWEQSTWRDDYVEHICNCVSLLRDVFPNRGIILKSHPAQVRDGSRWEDLLPLWVLNTTTVDYNSTYEKLTARAYLQIVTNNSTVLLRSMRSNVPSIVVLQGCLESNFRTEAWNCIRVCHESKLVHFGTQSLRVFLDSNSEYIYRWWRSRSVRASTDHFTNMFVRSLGQYLVGLTKSTLQYLWNTKIPPGR